MSVVCFLFFLISFIAFVVNVEYIWSGCFWYFFFISFFFIYCNDYGVVVWIVNVTIISQRTVLDSRLCVSIRQWYAKFMNVIWHRHSKFQLADSYPPWLLVWFFSFLLLLLGGVWLRSTNVRLCVCVCLYACIFMNIEWIYKSMTSAIHALLLSI